jgi:hypothetical protein
MVATEYDIREIVTRFVAAVEVHVPVERILLAGDYGRGNPHAGSDIWFVVISPSFEGMDYLARSDMLALAGLEIDVRIQSWGFSSSEVARPGLIPLLSMMINESQEIYPEPRHPPKVRGGL